MANLRFPPTKEQLDGLHWASSMPAILSVLGASYIVQHILRSPQRRSKTLPRVVMGMSLMDLLSASIRVFGAILSPKDSPPLPFWESKYARGNWKTCEAFGFLQYYANVSSVVYNGSLAVCYLLTIRHGWRQEKLQKLEPVLHLVPHFYAFGTALAALVLDLYNPTPVACVIQEYPQGCQENGNCQRGKIAPTYRLVCFWGMVWAVFLVLCICMFKIFRYIRETHTKSNSYSFAPESSAEIKSNTIRNRFITQAVLYCGVFALTWVFGTFNSVVHDYLAENKWIPIIYLMTILESLPGFFNALVYLRPRYLSYLRRRNVEEAHPHSGGLHLHNISETFSEVMHRIDDGAHNWWHALCKAFGVEGAEGDEEYPFSAETNEETTTAAAGATTTELAASLSRKADMTISIKSDEHNDHNETNQETFSQHQSIDENSPGQDGAGEGDELSAVIEGMGKNSIDEAFEPEHDTNQSFGNGQAEADDGIMRAEET